MDDKNRHLSENEILKITNESMHKTFGYFGLDDSFSIKNKGGLGGFVEENIFGYANNSDDEPDFIDAGIELKVTPIKENQNGTISSKERLVLNMINYKKEANATFKTSSFYHKNKKLLIWFYLFKKGVNPSNFEIMDYSLLEFENSLEFKIIERDWNIIHNKIVNGKAHELSERDTELLAACTKGANNKVLVEQYNTNIKAKPRAYSFKSGFMTSLYRRIIHEMSPYSEFISDDEWMNNTLEEVYKEKVQPYIGYTISELARRFGIGLNNKSIGYDVAKAIFGFKGKKTNHELEESNIEVKTVRLLKNGTPAEDMSFPAFDFTELVTQKWEESEIRGDFIDKKILLFVYQHDNGRKVKDARFKEILFWNIPDSLIDGQIKKMYEEAADLVKNGDALKIDKNGKIIDKFPKARRNGNGICHIRPHGRNKKDKFALPVKDKSTGLTEYTKQCFWFNKQFIKDLIAKLEDGDLDSFESKFNEC